MIVILIDHAKWKYPEEPEKKREDKSEKIFAHYSSVHNFLLQQNKHGKEKQKCNGNRKTFSASYGKTGKRKAQKKTVLKPCMIGEAKKEKQGEVLNIFNTSPQFLK